MKIAVDCYEAGAYATGVGRSIEEVLKELVPMMPDDEFVALSKEPIEKYVPPTMVQHVLSADKGYFRCKMVHSGTSSNRFNLMFSLHPITPFRL